MTSEIKLHRAKALLLLIEAQTECEFPYSDSKSDKLWQICDEAVKKFIEEFVK